MYAFGHGIYKVAPPESRKELTIIGMKVSLTEKVLDLLHTNMEEQTNIYVWVLQLMFAKSILPGVEQRPDTTQIRAVKEGLARWRRGETGLCGWRLWTWPRRRESLRRKVRTSRSSAKKYRILRELLGWPNRGNIQELLTAQSLISAGLCFNWLIWNVTRKIRINLHILGSTVKYYW